ncbi:hypothetical protein K456DRAFT_292580 [Colletotrichum gloeosporioides 23]|nr:hypothetical protein K456DRAFT_292580 [Colletotrichum gloeosporioides 23]
MMWKASPYLRHRPPPSPPGTICRPPGCRGRATRGGKLDRRRCLRVLWVLASDALQAARQNLSTASCPVQAMPTARRGAAAPKPSVALKIQQRRTTGIASIWPAQPGPTQQNHHQWSAPWCDISRHSSGSWLRRRCRMPLKRYC